jgi:1,4-dihydroxy-2-naphthoate octaprenyltransferase
MSNMSSLKTEINLWVRLIRPQTLPIGLGPILVALGLTLKDKFPLKPLEAILTFGVLGLLQIAANLINEYFDFKTGVDDEREFGFARLPRHFPGGAQFLKKMKIVYQILLISAFSLGIYVSYLAESWGIFLLGLTSLVAAYFYTAGPMPFSKIGLGEWAAFIFFGPVAVLGCYRIQSGSFFISVDSFFTIFFASLTPGLFSTLMMMVNNIRDQHTDLKAGKKTLVHKIGDENMRKLVFFVLMIVSVIPLLFWGLGQNSPNLNSANENGVFDTLFLSGRSWLLISAFMVIPYWPLIKGVMMEAPSAQFNRYLKRAGQFAFLHALTFSLGLGHL